MGDYLIELGRKHLPFPSVSFNLRHLKTSCGAIAQLGERNNGIVEVTGSIPVGSTIFFFM